MAKHPPTSMDIDPEIQYDKSTLAISRTGSRKSTVVTPQKDISQFYHQVKKSFTKSAQPEEKTFNE